VAIEGRLKFFENLLLGRRLRYAVAVRWLARGWRLCNLQKITIAALTVRPLERVEVCRLGGATQNIFFVLNILFTNEF
jgi:hypothetical protein